MASTFLRSPGLLIGFANLFAIGGATAYLRNHLVFNHEESEARLDEIEGTLRGHIGLIYESLERLGDKGGEAGEKTNELYGTRGKHEKQKQEGQDKTKS